MTTTPGTTLPTDLYALVRSDLVDLVRGLSDGQLTQLLPLCPEWTAKEIVSHVCGINADLINKRLDGLGTDAWTAAQISERSSRTLEEVCDEWVSYDNDIRKMMIDDPFLGNRLVADATIHLHDVQHGLGLPIDREAENVIVAAHRYVPHLQDRVSDTLGLGISINLTDGSAWPSPIDSDAITLHTTPYDFLRSVSGRRSRRQVEALDWSADPAVILDEAWNAYGPFTSDDVSA